MEKQKRSGTPAAGIIIITIAILAGLGLFWAWTSCRADVYRKWALKAAAESDWDRAFSLGEKADNVGASGTVTEVRYEKAEALYAAAEYAEAAQLYAALTGYRDADRMIIACRYGLAEEAERAGDLEAARDGFMSAAGYSDALSRADGCRYAIAERMLAEGDAQEAMLRFLELGDFLDARQRAEETACALTGETDPALALLYAQGYEQVTIELADALSDRREQLASDRLAAGHAQGAVLLPNGTVYYLGDDAQVRDEVEGWTDIVAVSAGYAHILGLRSDGSVAAAGDNSCGQCETAQWANVSKIVCGPWDSYAICADGTLLCCGYCSDQSITAGWTDVAALGAGEGALFAVRKNGTLLSNRTEWLRDWHDLCAVCSAGNGPVGLNRFGNVLSDDEALAEWTDVIDVRSSAALLVGLRADGTLLYRPLMPVKDELLAALAAEKDVTGISVAGTYVLLLHADGTLSTPGAGFDGSGSGTITQ